MGCCHGYAFVDGGESVFSVDLSSVTFGPGALGELGERVRVLGSKRVALFTDKGVAAHEHVEVALKSLRAAGVDVAVYDETHIEPTSASFMEAAKFAGSGTFDGYVSVGGGSVIDTCKAALLYATYPADLRAYVNAPIGEGRPIPGALPLHVACPTTCGTGSECTGIAVFDHVELSVKTAIASPRLRPTLALIDPTCTRTLPASVVAASGFDVLCHGLESFTARPFTARARSVVSSARPMSQGRNPWSDLGSLEAVRIAGQFLVRAVRDATDTDARASLAWAATLAGIAFGNSGVHLPHAMSYSVAGQSESLVPHGFSVVVNAPSVFRVTARTSPERHLQAAVALGADARGAASDDGGELLMRALVTMMRDAQVPGGLAELGYGEGDLDALVTGAIAQKRLIDNAPLPVDEALMRELFAGALRYR